MNILMKSFTPYLFTFFLSLTSSATFALNNTTDLQTCKNTWANSSADFAGICNLNDSADFIHYESYFPTHPCSVQATCSTGVGGEPPIQSFLRYKENEPHIIDCSGELLKSANCPTHIKRIG
jgi:hypothetical protein